MGQYLTFDQVRKRFAEPLAQLGADMADLCDRWEDAHEADEIVRPDLLLNDATAESALGILRKFYRETTGKLEDAVAGVYRYRDSERKRAKK